MAKNVNKTASGLLEEANIPPDKIYQMVYLFFYLCIEMLEKSKSKAERTRQFIIQQSAALCNTKGYAATTLSDIIRVTGLSKGSIYGNFSNKDEIVAEAFQYNVNMLYAHMDQAINQVDDPYEKILRFVQFYREHWQTMVDGGGCAMLNAATEADDNLLYLHHDVKQSFIRWQERLTFLIEEGKNKGIFKNVAAIDYAYTLIMLIEGGILLSRTLNDKRHLETALDRVIIIVTEELLV